MYPFERFCAHLRTRSKIQVTFLTGFDRQILRCRIPKLSKSRTLSFLNGFDPTSCKIHQIAMKLREVYLMELQ
ncbi:hypothetical protein K1719_037508 [Acacia pycnantha]|nr:hypothetical protein K1719_037508 [Acacia pycnantha]